MSVSEWPVALLAGFLSFLAPCVLPLVPGYLSAVSAVEADRLGQPGTARRVVAASVPFVLGFSAVFVALGVAAALVGGSLFRDQFLLEKVSGFVLVVFGLAFMGLLPWPERLVGAGLVQGARSRGSRLLLGGAFAVCAAPCIGPVLAGDPRARRIIRTAFEGALLLAVYSLGLAIPFVLAGALFTRAMGAFRWLRDHYRAIQFAGGVLMVALGLLLFFGRFYWLRIYLNRLFEWLGRLVAATRADGTDCATVLEPAMATILLVGVDLLFRARLEGLSAGAPTRHERQRRPAGPRDLRHRRVEPRRSPTRGRRSRSSASRTTRTPSGYARTCRRLRSGDRQVGTRGARPGRSSTSSSAADA